MHSQLVCRPEQDLPVAVLRVSGVLDAVTGGALERAVRRSLCAQPRALIVDVADVLVADPHALAALSALLCQNAEFPAVPVTLCAASPATAQAVAASPDCASVAFADSCEEAIERARAAPEPRRVRVRLRPVPDACRQVRRVVTQACAAWQRSELAATAALVATELVANVVRHAHTTMEFTVGLRGGALLLTVRDGSRRLPEPADARLSDAGGRGLRLVRELTESWGVVPAPDGKVVWTRLTSGVPA
jgi:anti-sigma regulatory factor (Ser/Thr protein kinase)/anti-anti-sigma regulatory factor